MSLVIPQRSPECAAGVALAFALLVLALGPWSDRAICNSLGERLLALHTVLQLRGSLAEHARRRTLLQALRKVRRGFF